jgi:hypothetical protein
MKRSDKRSDDRSERMNIRSSEGGREKCSENRNIEV